MQVPETCSTDDISLRATNCTEGRSLADIVKRNNSSPNAATGKSAAFGQWPMTINGENRMGYIIHTTVPAFLDPAEAEVALRGLSMCVGRDVELMDVPLLPRCATSSG